MGKNDVMEIFNKINNELSEIVSVLREKMGLAKKKEIMLQLNGRIPDSSLNEARGKVSLVSVKQNGG